MTNDLATITKSITDINEMDLSPKEEKEKLQELILDSDYLMEIIAPIFHVDKYYNIKGSYAYSIEGIRDNYKKAQEKEYFHANGMKWKSWY